MIIADNSPLRRFSFRDRTQSLFFDGIRYSIDMVDVSYNRLQKTLTDIAVKRDIERIKMVTAFSDAWSIVDSVYRLRSLLCQTPKLKQHSPYLKIFQQKTQDFEAPRHIIQHLNGIHKVVNNSDLHILGTLSWFTVLDNQTQEGRTCVIGAGTLPQSKFNYHLVNPCGKLVQLPTDLITLKVIGKKDDKKNSPVGIHSVSLSDVMQEVEKLTRGLESDLVNKFKVGHCVTMEGSDLFACADFTPDL